MWCDLEDYRCEYIAHFSNFFALSLSLFSLAFFHFQRAAVQAAVVVVAAAAVDAQEEKNTLIIKRYRSRWAAAAVVGEAEVEAAVAAEVDDEFALNTK